MPHWPYMVSWLRPVLFTMSLFWRCILRRHTLGSAWRARLAVRPCAGRISAILQQISMGQLLHLAVRLCMSHSAAAFQSPLATLHHQLLFRRLSGAFGYNHRTMLGSVSPTKPFSLLNFPCPHLWTPCAFVFRTWRLRLPISVADKLCGIWLYAPFKQKALWRCSPGLCLQ